MIYVVRELIGGAAQSADDEELEEFGWSAQQNLREYIQYSPFELVQEHLNTALSV